MNGLMKDSITSRSSKHSREQNSRDSNFGFIFPGQNASLQQGGSRHEKLRNQSRQEQSRHRRAEKYKTDSQDSLNSAIQRQR